MTAVPPNYKEYPFFELFDESWNTIFFLAYGNWDGQYFRFHLTEADVSYYSFDPFIADVWYCIEVYITRHATTGAFKVWIDNSLEIDESGKDTDRGSGYKHTTIGLCWGPPTTFYIDLFSIAESRIGPETLFEDGFETGDFSRWLGTTADTGCSATVVSERKHHGTYCGKFVTDDAGEKAMCYWHADSPLTAFYVRLYANLDNLPGDVKIQYLGLIYDDDWEGIAQWGVRQDSGVYKLTFRRQGNVWYESSGITIAADTWYCFEIKLIVHDTNGEIKYWLDGSLKINQTGIDTKHTGVGAKYIYTGNCESEEPCTIYVDCYVLAEEYIGPEPFEKTVTDTLGLADAIPLTDKVFSITETLGLSDADPIRDKVFSITDVLGLVESILCDKTFSITDALSLAEVISVDKALIISEAISAAEQIIVDKVLSVADTSSLSDAILRDKQFTIQEAISLLEEIIVSKAFITVTDSITLTDSVIKLMQVMLVLQLANKLVDLELANREATLKLAEKRVEQEIV